MKSTNYEERYARKEIVDAEYFWLDGNCIGLEAFPMIIGIKPGEEVATGYSNEVVKAPEDGEEFELWHYCTTEGCHVKFEFRCVKKSLSHYEDTEFKSFVAKTIDTEEAEPFCPFGWGSFYCHCAYSSHCYKCEEALNAFLEK